MGNSKSGFASNPNNINRNGANKSKRTKDWEELGDYLVNEGAVRFIKHLMESDDKEFSEKYIAILNYFKPKQQQVAAKIEVVDLPIIELVTDQPNKLNGQADILK